jgi:hypothetical protein
MEIFTQYPAYSVLLCRKHCCAVYGLNEYLKRQHSMPAAEQRELLALYKDFALLAPGEVTQPVPYSSLINELGPVQDAFLCICSSNANSAACGFISISRAKMRQHVNQQHNVKLMRWSSPTAASYQEHAAKLWQPVKVQTFFRERRYIRYFVVQEDAQAQQGDEQQGDEQQSDEQQSDEQQGDKQQGDKQQGDKQQGNYKQTLTYLASSLTALKRKDSKAIDYIAEESSAKDCTGWFKRTQWDKHLQVYPD